MDALSRIPWDKPPFQLGEEFDLCGFDADDFEKAKMLMLNTLPLSPKGINIPDLLSEVLSDVQNAQKYDYLGNALKKVMDGWELPLNDRLRATALAMQPYCEQFNGILYYGDPHMEHYRIYALASLRRELLHLHHDCKVGGHFGFLKVLR